MTKDVVNTSMKHIAFSSLLALSCCAAHGAAADKPASPAKTVKSIPNTARAKPAPAKPAPKTTASSDKRLKCGMKMSTKKTLLFHVPYRSGGKTYWCCSFCGMPASKESVTTPKKK